MKILNRYTDEIIFEDGALTIKETVQNAIEQGISLSGSDLSYSKLSGSDLRGSDLRGSDLRGSDLRGSDLRGSNLRGSDLRDSNLRGSDLRGSDIDFSCLPLWCGSKGIKIDERQAKQLFMHVFNIGLKYFPGGLTEEQKDWVNTCHRIQDGSFPKF